MCVRASAVAPGSYFIVQRPSAVTVRLPNPSLSNAWVAQGDVCHCTT